MLSDVGKKTPPPQSSWTSGSEPPAPLHTTNATAELISWNGNPANPSQVNACPTRDDSEQTRPATTPSVPHSDTLSPSFTLLERAYDDYDPSPTYMSDDMALFRHPPSIFSQWTQSPFTVNLVGYNCAEQFMMASKARLFGDDMALSAILASDDPREQRASGVRCVTLNRHYGRTNSKLLSFEATLRNYLKTKGCVLL